MLGAFLRQTMGEQQVRIGHGGIRPTLAIGAALVLVFGATGCARQETPAPKAAAPAAPAAAPAPAAAAAVVPVLDGPDKLTHGRYLVETVAGCGNCHTPHLPDG